MTVQVEPWWNSSDVAVFLREENAWVTDGTVDVVGKRNKYVPTGGSTAPTVEHDEQTLLLDDYAHVEEETVKYGYKDPSLDLLRHSYFHIWVKNDQHIGWHSFAQHKEKYILMWACIFCHDLFDINPKFRAFGNGTSWQVIEPMFVAPWWTKSLYYSPKMGDPLHLGLNIYMSQKCWLTTRTHPRILLHEIGRIGSCVTNWDFSCAKSWVFLWHLRHGMSDVLWFCCMCTCCVWLLCDQERDQKDHLHNITFQGLVVRFDEGLKPKYVLGSDEFGMWLFPTSQWKWEKKGAEEVKSVLKQDKRQYPDDLVMNMDGEVIHTVNMDR